MNKKHRRNEVGGYSAGTGVLSGMIQSMVDKSWRSRYWPDGSKLFLNPGIALGKKLVSEKNIDRIISVGLPFTCHLIAQALKDDYPHVHWHMDIQDPFSYSKEFWVNNFSKYEDRNVKAEKEAFIACDAASVTNERAMEKYVELIPESQGKLSVIPPLFSPFDDAQKYDMQLFEQKIHLSYCGSFYSEVRSPERFLKFLTRLHEDDPSLMDRFQFHFIGQLDSHSRAILSSYSSIRRWYVLHGFKTRSQCMDAMLQSDVLLNFGNTTDYHLPSKVVDLLYCAKPVVNLISHEEDSTGRFMEGRDLAILNLQLDDNEFSAQKNAFLKFISEPRTSSPSDKAVAACLPEVLATDYLD